MQSDWQPATVPEILRLRAEMLGRIRQFFSERQVLEVDTPALSRAAATDPALHSFTTRYHGPGAASGAMFYLHTSPEFPMKRLLAAGSGSIYQVSKVFRDAEAGDYHNPEFTLLEWYRTEFDHLDLMDEVEQLLSVVLEDIAPFESVQHWTYRDLFREFAGIDPFTTTASELQACLVSGHGIDPVGLGDDLDAWLDLAMTHVIEPRLGKGLVFVRDYPVSQAALARLRPTSPPVAARFEVYLDGVELANGFHELADAVEQRKRFEEENVRRQAAGTERVEMDERLLAALESGLPDCAGVALGVDRLLMLAAGADSIREVIPFPLDRA